MTGSVVTLDGHEKSDSDNSLTTSEEEGFDTEHNENLESHTIPTGSDPSQNDHKVTCESVSHELEIFGSRLKQLSSESDPQFVKIGRDLTRVTEDVKKLTETIRLTVNLVLDDQEDKASLNKVEVLVNDVYRALGNDRSIIETDASQIKDLVSGIFKYDHVKEKIDRINALFRIVRVNLRIQCSAQGISDDLFAGVSEDLEHLSANLQHVTKQVLQDIKQGTKSLTRLQESTAEHLQHIDSVYQSSQNIVSKALSDINQLIKGTETMIRDADTRAQKISNKVNDIVVGIQFHDSLNQRVEHVRHAFNDIRELIADSDVVSEVNLGTSFVILDLQLRQLQQISKEIKLVRQRIEDDFLTIETEVKGLSASLYDSQFRQVSPQHFLGDLFSSLEKTLLMLNGLFDEGEDMIKQVEQTTHGTRSIAGNLKDLQERISEMYEETRVQAVNTIIMASSLGQKGKTIEVLAKEIQALSNQSIVLADDVEAMFLAVEKIIDELESNTRKKSDHLEQGELTAEISSIKQTFGKALDLVSSLTQQVETSSNNIRSIRSALIFLSSLEESLDLIVHELAATRERLTPWEDEGLLDGEEIDKLKERYSMAQERMIHMLGSSETDQEMTDDDDVFF